MKIQKLLIVILALAVMLSVYTPAPVAAASGTMSLIVTNNTPKMVTIILSGPSVQKITAYPGQTTHVVPAGRYKFIYSSCGAKAKKGNVKNKAGAGYLVIPMCKMATWTFFNLDKKMTFTMVLSGYLSYTLSVQPRNWNTISVVEGDYTARVTWCGLNLTDRITFKGKKKLWIDSCY